MQLLKGNVDIYFVFFRFKRTFFKTLMQDIQEVEAEHVSSPSLLLHLPCSLPLFAFISRRFCIKFTLFFSSISQSHRVFCVFLSFSSIKFMLFLHHFVVSSRFLRLSRVHFPLSSRSFFACPSRSPRFLRLSRFLFTWRSRSFCIHFAVSSIFWVYLAFSNSLWFSGRSKPSYKV